MEITPLSEKLFDYIEESKGWFSLDEVYRTLSIKEDRDKTNIRVQLHKLSDTDKGVIEKHQRVNGRYRKIDTREPEAIDFSVIDPNKTAEIYMPFDLQDFIDFYDTNVVVYAGVTNQFKTEMLTHTAYLNQHRKGVFLNTEMDPVEQFKRITKYQPWDAWRNTKFPKRVLSDDIPNLIEKFYKDDLVFIDYLMPGDNDEGYLGISKAINRIGNAFRKGIGFIGLQKNEGKEFGRGGQPTLDLPRLYINLDPGPVDIERPSGYSFGTTEMKIMKCKNPKDPKYNPNGWKFIFRNTSKKDAMPLYKMIFEPPAYAEYNKHLRETVQINIGFDEDF